MGYLDRIEAARQQRIHESLESQTAHEARMQALVDETRKHEEGYKEMGKSFVEDAGTITQILDFINTPPMQEYFKKAFGGFFSNRQAFGNTPTMTFFMRNPHGVVTLKPGASSTPAEVDEIDDLNSQQREAKIALDNKVLDSGLLWGITRTPDRQAGLSRENIFRMSVPGHLDLPVTMVGTQFFGDSVNNKRFSEPEDVGIGLRFAELKHTATRIDTEKVFTLNGYFPSSIRVTTRQYSAFYVRIKGSHDAVITGASIQKVVDLSDIKSFDEALEQASTQPFFPVWTENDYSSPQANTFSD